MGWGIKYKRWVNGIGEWYEDDLVNGWEVRV